MPARVAKQFNELGKVRVQTEGFRDATDVVMGQSVVICTRLAMQRYKVLTAGNLGTLVGAVFNAVKQSSVPETPPPSHTALWRAASF